MSRLAKKITSIVLVLALVLSVAVTAIASGTNTADKIYYANSLEDALDVVGGETSYPVCDGNCGVSPLIIVPGIMQSQVYIQDENGNDILTSDGFPITEGMDLTFMLDTVKFKKDLPKLILPLIKSLLTRNKDYFIDKLVEIFDENLQDHYFNPDGTRCRNVAVDEYWYSLEECKKHPDKSYNYAKGYDKDENGNPLPTTRYKTQYDFIVRQVDIRNFCEKYGYDHTYYYAYSSFGDTFSIAERFNEYVQMVKEQTGHDKVSIVFISLGGTIANVYLSQYCNPADIDRIVFAAAAVNGSSLLSDIMSANFNFKNNEVLYSGVVTNLLYISNEEGLMWAGYLANILLRIIPNKVFSDWVNTALERLCNEVLLNITKNCPSMWATIPAEKYPAISEKLISDEAHKELKAKADAYYNIQKNAKQTIRRLRDEGMEIFVVCGYNLGLPAVLGSYGLSSDNIIEASSTSIGATFAPCDETLPDDYIPAIDESYISPHKDVDAGTAALPDSTWFVRNQSHNRLQASINDIVTMCIEIAVDHNIKDARENNGGYAQFNNYRNLRLIERFLGQYAASGEERLAAANPTPEQVERLNKAIETSKALLAKKEWDYDEAWEVEKELYTIMYELRFIDNMADYQPPEVRYAVIPAATEGSKWLSDFVYKYHGAKDFYGNPKTDE
ncbi:MAG: alpha/beta hydrolase [Clostridiales bacterium]|nr:alpha/beta hydrolase [Clostridiales bacterium]